MTTATLESETRIYFSGCEDEECVAKHGPDHHHGDQFRKWKAQLSPAQLASLGEQANAFQKSMSWVASHVGVAKEPEKETQGK